MNVIKTIACAVIFVITAPLISNAQLFKGNAHQERPKAILVELHSEKGKIAYYANTYPKESEKIKKEAANVRKVTMNDYRDHFRFCPVYFFIDTDADYIMRGEFQDHLFDMNGQIATDIVLSPRDTDFYIASYGHIYTNPNIVTRNGEQEAYLDNKFLIGMALYNYKFQQIPATTYQYIYVHHPLIRIVKPDPRYNYESKEFNIEYLQTASKLNAALTKYFDNHR